MMSEQGFAFLVQCRVDLRSHIAEEIQLVTQSRSVDLIGHLRLEAAPTSVLDSVQALGDETELDVSAAQDVGTIQIMGHTHMSHLHGTIDVRTPR